MQSVAFEVRAVDTKDVVVVNSATSREMNRRSKNKGFGGTLLGQTDAAFGARVVTEPRECGRTAVVLEVHLVKQTVQVASDLPKDSCTYRETYDHELEHVAINRKVLVSVQMEFSGRFEASRYATAAALTDAVTTSAMPAVMQRFRDSSNLHTQYDSDDKHAPRSEECKADLTLRTAAM